VCVSLRVVILIVENVKGVLLVLFVIMEDNVSKGGSKLREFKCVVMGSGGVGKSALTILNVNGVFVEKYDPTIEDTYRKIYELDGVSYVLEILDTAGTEQYTAQTDFYTRDGHGFVIVYSITSMSSFAEIPGILERIKRIKNVDKVAIVICGNKCDLVDQRVVMEDEGRSVAKKWDCTFIETSAKNGINTARIFPTLIKEVVKLHPESEKERKKGKCIIL